MTDSQTYRTFSPNRVHNGQARALGVGTGPLFEQFVEPVIRQFAPGPGKPVNLKTEFLRGE